MSEYLSHTCQLYDAIYENVQKNDILIEVGSDEGVLGQKSLDEQFRFHDELDAKFESKGWQLPVNRVIDIGTHVFELNNEGNSINNDELCESVERLNQLNKRNFNIKVHNCDYLEQDKMDILLKINNSQFNISPELAAIENELVYSNLSNKQLVGDCVEEIAKSPLFKKWVRGTIDELSVFKLGFHYIENSFLAENQWYEGWRKEHASQRVEIVKGKMEAFYALG